MPKKKRPQRAAHQKNSMATNLLSAEVITNLLALPEAMGPW